jgi:lipopolysaccharide transport system ATP-binding protein
VSFDVTEGEVIGIIGHNGAGKSTLLKILSGITEPTEGEVRMSGRVGALLEVGTGFHQELSGRENIFMNGAILGMRKAEILRKFDEIVMFAGVERFVDTPVKRYSTGMLVRLGFAVAAHLQPEILIIDEVLAVGDAEFQRKCFGKLEDVSRSGRTVLFVSHNLATVESVCTRCLLVANGAVVLDGPTHEVIAAYHETVQRTDGPMVQLYRHPGRASGRTPLMVKVTTCDHTGAPCTSFTPGESVTFVVEHTSLPKPMSPVLGVIVKTPLNAPILGVDNSFVGGFRLRETQEPGRITCTLPRLPLLPGQYPVDLYLGDPYWKSDYIRCALRLDIRSEDVYGTGRLPKPAQHGPVLWNAEWRWEPSTQADDAVQ